MFENKNLISILKIMFRIKVITGFAPFGMANSSKLLKFLGFVWCVSCTVIRIYLAVSYIMAADYYRSLIMKIYMYSSQIQTFIVYTAIPILSTLFHSKTRKCLARLEEVDQIIERLKINNNLNKYYQKTYFLVVILTTYVIGYVGLIAHGFWTVYGTNILQVDAVLIVTFMLFNCLMFTRFHIYLLFLFLKQRYQWINSHLIWRSTSWLNVSQIIDLHNRLNLVTGEIYQTHATQLLLLIVQTFVASITVTSMIFSDIFANIHVPGSIILGSLEFLLAETGWLILILVTCDQLSKEINSFGDSIASSKIWKNGFELEVYCYQLKMLGNKFKISGHGMFVINLSLFYTIFSTVATYLIVILQLDIGLQKK